ncbi:putative J domain-containing protein [Smittium mucronatum]|uniref:Putative J domain-containing protein n=1 Tax=Smittium mucronatum TaxID=133383 RepID=A0A1R0H2H2_9FUNG|nr:putative J domain-containing protein [Smittium mucronatum]
MSTGTDSYDHPVEATSEVSLDQASTSPSIPPELSASDKLKLEEWITSAERENATKKDAGDLDYYSILGIKSNAEDEDIREAYRKKSRLFHPDKHSNSEVKEWASSQFQQIQRAYEVLINPIQRAAYDAVGEKGLSMDMEIGSRFMSKYEIRQEFERKVRMEKEKDIAALVNSKSEIVLGMNVSVLTSASLHDMLLKRGIKIKPISTLQEMYWAVQRQKLVTKHKFVIPFGNTLNASISGQASFKGKLGVGNVGIGLAHSNSPGVSTEISLPILPPHTATIKRSVQLNSESFYNVEATAHSLVLETPPSISATYGQSITQRLTGFLSVRTGNRYYIGDFWKQSPTRTERTKPSAEESKKSPVRNYPRDYSSVTLGIAGQMASDVQINTSATFSVPQQQLAMQLTKQIDSQFSLDCGITIVASSHELGDYAADNRELDEYEIPRSNIMQAIMLHFGGEMSITEFEQFGYRFDFGLNTHMTFTLKYSRLGQVFRLPVMVSPVFDLDLMLYLLALPTAFATGYNLLVLRPRKLARLKQRMLDLENEILQSCALKQKNYNHIVKLLDPVCEQKCEIESKKNGLIITKAFYGDVGVLYSDSIGRMSTKSELMDTDKLRAIDVRVILMALVNDSQLVIPTSKSGLQGIVGFYNPLVQNLVDDSTVLDKTTDEFLSAKRVQSLVNSIGTIMDSLPKFSSILWNPPQNEFGNTRGPKSVVQQITKIRPQLYIEYMFRNKLHRAIIDDFGSIAIPLEGKLSSYISTINPS